MSKPHFSKECGELQNEKKDMPDEKNEFMISNLKKKNFSNYHMTKLPVLKTTGICRLLTSHQRSQNVTLLQNIKSFKIAYDVVYHFTDRPRPAHNLSSQKSFKTRMITMLLYRMGYKRNVMPCLTA